jgi:hypothetical protein
MWYVFTSFVSTNEYSAWFICHALSMYASLISNVFLKNFLHTIVLVPATSKEYDRCISLFLFCSSSLFWLTYFLVFWVEWMLWHDETWHAINRTILNVKTLFVQIINKMLHATSC